MSEELIKEFLKRDQEKALNIHCVGDAMVDEYYEVSVNRISPEFPMPIMHSSHDFPTCKPGGVANVAHQFKHFHVCPTLICLPDPVANSVFAQNCIYYYQGTLDINCKLPVKKRFLADGIQVTRHDIESPLCGLKQETINCFIKSLSEAICDHKIRPDIAILSDYNKGFFSSEETNMLDSYRDVTTIVDPKKGPLNKWKGCTVFKPNAAEAEALTGRKAWKEQVKHIQNELECQSVVITYHGEKVVGIDKNEFFFHKMDNKVNVDSVVGAGDCFCAFLAMAIGRGFSVSEAAEIAYQAGSIYVQHRMNRPVCPAELVSGGIVQPHDLVKRDFKLVFTNGCFDVLHAGHIQTLKYAKSKGDKLVVALNSDASIKRLKGDSRPIVPLEHRMAVVSSFDFVDFVVSFDDDNPYQLIKTIAPDVLVKGGQYELGNIVGSDIVPEVHRAPMIDGISSTTILNS